MGRPKLLLSWQTSTIIEHVLSQWVASRVAHIVMVVHPMDELLADVARRAGAQVVVPAVPPRDMKASVGHALAWIANHLRPQTSDAWLLAPADMPLLTAELIDAVIEADETAAERQIVAPVCGGKQGHPVLFPWKLASEVEGLTADQGLNALVERHTVREVPWRDLAAFHDVDTPSDYARLQPGSPAADVRD